MTWNYYNEVDAYAAQWLRNLIAAGHLPDGEVDERSITDVWAEDLKGFSRCHWFAGIGIWPLALRRAGLDDLPVWTGSCPCQPFSAAGKQKGFEDERHLWPVWFDLIAECRPPVILGEQVASALAWFDLIQADLEDARYAVGASDLCAAGFGGAHIRQRLYFVGAREGVDHAASARRLGSVVGAEVAARDEARLCLSGSGSGHGRVADALRERTRRSSALEAGQADPRPGTVGQLSSATRSHLGTGGLAHTHGGAAAQIREGDDTVYGQRSAQRGWEQQPAGARAGGRDGGGVPRPGDAGERAPLPGELAGPHAPLLGRTPVDWLFCRDGKWRPVEPSFVEMASAYPCRVGPLRAPADEKVEEVIADAEVRFSTTRGKILRALRGSDASEDIQDGQVGGPLCTSEAQVLLASLLEYHGQGGGQPYAGNGPSALESARQRLRVLWRGGAARHTPRERELEGQLAGEPADALRELSSAVARAAQEAGYPYLVTYAPASRPLSDGSEDPHKNRVGKLRAYGNALDLGTAQGFVEAVAEALADFDDTVSLL